MDKLSLDLFSFIIDLLNEKRASNVQQIAISNESFDTLTEKQKQDREIIHGGFCFKLLVPNKDQFKYTMYTLE